MGFFRAAGFAFGNEVGEARGSARYLPIRTLTREQLAEGNAGSPYVELGDLIQKHADDIAEMISRDRKGGRTFSTCCLIASER